MTPTDHLKLLRRPEWARWIALGLALAMAVVFYLSASPHSHHEIHPDCDTPEHSCVVTQWSGGFAFDAPPVWLPPVVWRQEFLLGFEAESRPHSGPRAWSWSQAPPRTRV